MDTEEENTLFNLSIEVLYEESVETTQKNEGMEDIISLARNTDRIFNDNDNIQSEHDATIVFVQALALNEAEIADEHDQKTDHVAEIESPESPDGEVTEQNDDVTDDVYDHRTYQVAEFESPESPDAEVTEQNEDETGVLYYHRTDQESSDGEVTVEICDLPTSSDHTDSDIIIYDPLNESSLEDNDSAADSINIDAEFMEIASSLVETSNSDVSTGKKLSKHKMKIAESGKKNSGQPYVTSKGKQMPGRSMEPLPNCRKKCKDLLPEDVRKRLFTQYWELKDFNKRKCYINNLIKRTPTATMTRVVTKFPRENVFHYSVNFDNMSIDVCKNCFLVVFGESSAFLNNLLKKKVCSPANISVDGRGGARHKLSEQIVKDIEEHIASFPTYESHYCRERTNKRYLPTNLSERKMYALYIEKYKPAASYQSYTKILKGKNLRFKKYQTDTCNKCDLYAEKIRRAETDDERNRLKEAVSSHQKVATEAYLEKKQDKLNPQVTVLCFDLQQVLPTPFITSNLAFYKRQLSTYNLTVKNCRNGKSVCYMWDETVSARGSNEISSCLYHYLTTEKFDTSDVVLFSDNCYGQNKNYTVAAMFQKVLADNPCLKTITHKFLEVGHTHLECDGVHGQIEKKKKRYGLPISHPHDWRQLVRSCNCEVVNMTRENFLDFAAYNKSNFLQKFKVMLAGEPVNINWRNIRAVKVVAGEFDAVYLKEFVTDDNFMIADRGKRLKRKFTAILEPTVLNATALPVPVKKKKDLLELLPFIDKQFWPFYQQLKGDGALKDTDPDIYESDFDDFDEPE